MIKRHLEGVMAHWIRRTTNVFLEGLNSVFSAVKRKARGFRSTQNLIAMLYFTAGRLDLPLPTENSEEPVSIIHKRLAMFAREANMAA